MELNAKQIKRIKDLKTKKVETNEKIDK